jgi:hypothetical protein
MLMVLEVDYLTDGGDTTMSLMIAMELMSPRRVPDVRVCRIVVADRRMRHVYVRLPTVRDLDVGRFRVLCYRYRR